MDYSTISCGSLRSRSQRGEVYKKVKPSFFGGAGVQCRGRKEKGQLPPLFLYTGPLRLKGICNRGRREQSLPPTKAPAATRFQHKLPPLGAWVALFQGTTPRSASGHRQGAQPLPSEAPTRGARTRGLPPRLRLGWTPARLSPDAPPSRPE